VSTLLFFAVVNVADLFEVRISPKAMLILVYCCYDRGK
jgi:hypothetical protein